MKPSVCYQFQAHRDNIKFLEYTVMTKIQKSLAPSLAHGLTFGGCTVMAIRYPETNTVEPLLSSHPY